MKLKRTQALGRSLCVFTSAGLLMAVGALGCSPSTPESPPDPTSAASPESPSEAPSEAAAQHAEAAHSEAAHAVHGGPESMPSEHDGAAQAAEHAGHGAHANHQAMPPAELPGTSIYHLDINFVDQTSTPVRLSTLRGTPAVFVMFYSSCTTACPILFADGRRLEALLPEAIRAQVRFVYVSIDPATDTPQVLSEYAGRLGLDSERWKLLSGDDGGTRELAAVLGVQFRADGEGHFSHTNRMSIVDADGSVVGIVDGLQQPLEAAAAQLTALVSDPH